MRKGKWVILLIIVALIGGGISYYLLYQNMENERTNISVSGNIEATTVDVAFKIPGKIDKLLVDEGDFVKEGQLIAILEHRDLLAQKAKAEATLESTKSRIPALLKNIEFQDRATLQEISQAEAAVEAAHSRFQQLLTGARPQEIQAAKAEVDQTLADMEKRKADMDRAKKLYQDKYISAQEWDSARTAYEMSTASHQRAKENYALVVEGPRKEEIDAARAQWNQSRAALRLAKTRRMQVDVLRRELATAQAQVKEAASSIEVIQTQIEYSNLYAPTAGVVLVKNSEAGEFIVPGGAVITLGDVAKPWLKAFINESDLGRVKLGQKVTVTTDSYPGKAYPGKITFISSEAEFTPKNVQTAKERVKLVYRIKVSLANPHSELKPGMPADAKIHLKDG
jgi:HlyD family secretion protein